MNIADILKVHSKEMEEIQNRNPHFLIRFGNIILGVIIALLILLAYILPYKSNLLISINSIDILPCDSLIISEKNNSIFDPNNIFINKDSIRRSNKSSANNGFITSISTMKKNENYYGIIKASINCNKIHFLEKGQKTKLEIIGSNGLPLSLEVEIIKIHSESNDIKCRFELFLIIAGNKSELFNISKNAKILIKDRTVLKEFFSFI